MAELNYIRAQVNAKFKRNLLSLFCCIHIL